MTEAPFEPTPREQAMMDQNMAFARDAARAVINRAAELIAAGARGHPLWHHVLDAVLAASRPRNWPGRRVTREIAITAMLIQAAIEAAAVPR